MAKAVIPNFNQNPAPSEQTDQRRDMGRTRSSISEEKQKQASGKSSIIILKDGKEIEIEPIKVRNRSMDCVVHQTMLSLTYHDTFSYSGKRENSLYQGTLRGLAGEYDTAATVGIDIDEDDEEKIAKAIRTSNMAVRDLSIVIPWGTFKPNEVDELVKLFDKLGHHVTSIQEKYLRIVVSKTDQADEMEARRIASRLISDSIANGLMDEEKGKRYIEKMEIKPLSSIRHVGEVYCTSMMKLDVLRYDDLISKIPQQLTPSFEKDGETKRIITIDNPSKVKINAEGKSDIIPFQGGTDYYLYTSLPMKKGRSAVPIFNDHIDMIRGEFDPIIEAVSKFGNSFDLKQFETDINKIIPSNPHGAKPIYDQNKISMRVSKIISDIEKEEKQELTLMLSNMTAFVAQHLGREIDNSEEFDSAE